MPDIHICDDWLSCHLPDLHSVHSASGALAKQAGWTEVVAGLDSIAVQFDPADMTPKEAATMFQGQLANVRNIAINLPPLVHVPVCYDHEFAPDLSRVSWQLGLSDTEFIKWHGDLEFTVTILGFMPGFAYLQSDKDIPNIGRLDQPRRRISAGSIGIIGAENCIYSFDSPGGWPIIGRTPVTLFDAANNPPNWLAAGQQVMFEAIDRKQYDVLHGSNTP